MTKKFEPKSFDIPKGINPLTLGDIRNILGLAVKRDEYNKVIAFLCMLSAYTNDCQINLSFNAPSAAGKTYIPVETSKVFPADDVILVGYCSPTAFFHDYGVYDEKKQGYILDLSNKVLVFLDQPHNLLLQHLRPVLSHDQKELQIKITDKSQKAGIKTKNIFLIGYPAVIFCTAGLNIDEQEATRFLLLSPEISQEKIRASVYEKVKKESNSKQYAQNIFSDELRNSLVKRVKLIKESKITNIDIASPQLVNEMFFQRAKKLKPRHQRDIGRITSLIKVFALLNFWFRERNGDTLIANDEDISQAFELWDAISESQELNIPPYIFDLYKEIIVTSYKEKSSLGDAQGITKHELQRKHYEVYGRHIPDWQLRQDILPMLETAGLIIQLPDKTDKRKILIYPTNELTISKQ